MDSYVGRRILEPSDTSSSSNERAVPQTNPTPPSNMPALRSQGEFFMTGIVPAGPQPEESDCSICAEHLAEDVVQIARPCGHMFHAVCLLTWLQGDGRRNRTCPNCRCELYAAPVPQPSMNLAPPSRTREAIMEQRIQVQYETLRRAREDQINNLRVLENNLRSTQVALGREPTATRTPIPAQPVNFNHRPSQLSDTPGGSGRSRRQTHAENLGRGTDYTNIAHWRRQTAQEREDEEALAALVMRPPGSERVEERARLQSRHDLAVAEMRQLEAARLQDGLLHNSDEAAALERNLANLNRIRRDSIQQLQQFDRRAAEEDRSSNDSIPSIRTRRRQRSSSDDSIPSIRTRRRQRSSSDDSSPSIRTRRRQRMAARRAAGEDSSSDSSGPSIETRRRQRMLARQVAGEDSSSDVPSIVRMTRTHQAMANIPAAEEARSSHNSNPSSRVAGVNATLGLSRVSAARIEQDIQTLLDGASRGHTSQTPESSATNNIPPRPTQSAARGPSIRRAAPRNATEATPTARGIAGRRLQRVRCAAYLAGRSDGVPEEEVAEYYGFPGLAQLHDEAALANLSGLERMHVRAQAAAELAAVDMMDNRDEAMFDLFWRRHGDF